MILSMSYSSITCTVQYMIVYLSFAGCTGGILRLEGSGGRLEICIESQWISVCVNDWTDSAASVVCKQLGYESGKVHTFMVSWTSF